MLDRLEEVKRAVEQIQRDHDQSVGAYKELIKQIQIKFGCKTIKEAKALWTKLSDQERTIAKKYSLKLKQFLEENSEVLKKYGYSNKT
jgi:hypothetical protein